MMTRSQTAAWAGGKITGLGIWGARGESADSLADRTGALLATLDAVLGTRQWLLTDDRPFPSEPAARAATVEEFVSRDAHGDLTPDAGVSFALFSGETEVAVTLEFFVGTAFPTRRVAPNRVVVELVPANPEALSPSAVDAVLDGVVSAWSPMSAAFRNSALASASQGRGGYAPVVGYRTWVSRQVGAVATVTDGLKLRANDEGSLITAQDDWSADQVAAAVLATLERNGISTIPQTPPATP